MSETKSFARSNIDDVAQMAGVSTATVSRVINHTGPVAEETAKRVMKAIQALDYTPHAAARGLASNRTNIIGLLLPEIGSAYFTPMLRGIEQGIREGGYDLMVYSTGGGAKNSHRVSRPLAEHNTDGLLIFTNIMDEQELFRLHKIGFPVVMLHHTPPEGLGIPFVTFENKAGARSLIDHLIEVHGRRRIAFLRAEEGNEDSFWREKGYRESLNAHGISVDEELFGYSNFNQERAEKQVTEWLKAGLQMDAIFCGDDDGASGVLMALRTWGKRIPEEISVVGFDDVASSRYLVPPLTTVHAPIETAGYEAAHLLIQLIQKKDTVSPILLPTDLVIRQSCGCP